MSDSEVAGIAARATVGMVALAGYARLRSILDLNRRTSPPASIYGFPAVRVANRARHPFCAVDRIADSVIMIRGRYSSTLHKPRVCDAHYH